MTQTGSISTKGLLAYGIYAFSLGGGPVTVTQTGDIATQGDFAHGIYAFSYNGAGAVTVTQTGNITTQGLGAYGIVALSATGAITVKQTGNITTQGDFARGIDALSKGGGPVTVTQTGSITTQGKGADGINARSYGTGAVTVTQTGSITTQGYSANGILATSGGPITVTQTGNITTQGKYASGINVSSSNSPVKVTQTGNILTQGELAHGIIASTFGTGPITVTQTGNIATKGDLADGILAFSVGTGPITVTQTGNIATQGYAAYGISASSFGAVTVTQTGNITTNGYRANGIAASSLGTGPVTVTQTGNITTQGAGAIGISAIGRGTVTVRHTGTITTQGDYAYGIAAYGGGLVTVTHSGDITANGRNAFGILGASIGGSIAVTVGPGGTVQGGTGNGAGVSFGFGSGLGPALNNTLTNHGTVWALSGLAVRGDNGNETIDNYGTVIGRVGLGAGHDVFDNRSGGTFKAQSTSDFGSGQDLFRNRNGALVHTANNAKVAETTAFVNLETFQNQGTISTVDGGVGDVFTISNTPGGKDLNFSGSGGSTLAVDAFLGGPGSKADVFKVEGNVSGTTTVAVNNTNTGPGVFNPVGIPVLFVTGKTPSESNFQLAQPIDTGFFDYDLFFNPTGSGFWDLKSYPGAGAHLLPQLVTAAQDIWHQGSSTWFDRTADLRVLLNGGGAPASAGYGAAAPTTNFTPATWVRGSGSWLDRNDSAKTSAYGRTYKYNLDRELDTMDFQMGIDLGKRDFLSQGDILVFGMLGGFVHGNLDYDKILRNFDFDGGQVGAYATYLKGGLFVDTLLNMHLLEMDANHTLGFPSETDVTTVGLRTDSGYRFGSFNGGAFIEPLATLEGTQMPMALRKKRSSTSSPPSTF